LKKGLVIKTTGNWYSVKDENNLIFECNIKGNFRIKDIKSTNPIAIGDYVDFYTVKQPGNDSRETGIITEIHERKNYIVRRSQNLSKQAHIIAANIDQAFLVVTIDSPVTTTTFIDRFLASAEAYRIPVTLVFNKIDLYNAIQKDILKKLKTLYEGIGYYCISTSVINNTGITDLHSLMAGKINVLNGHSGVGKSSLINRLQPGLNLKIREISDSHNTGKHTTTNSEMYELDFGGFIIDTPGIKAYGMLDMEAWEISHYFREIFKVSKNCAYKNCTHTHEPECAVKQEVIIGNIAESRYISYLGLLEKDEKYRLGY